MSKKVSKLQNIYPWLIVGFFFAVLIFLNAFYLENWLDSDMAAEMMFSKLLAREGGIFASESWYYSTEFRFLYTHLLMGPLFRVTDNWHLIRMTTNIVFYIGMLAAYFYMTAPLQMDKPKRIVCSAALLLPFSENMMLHMHMGNTYMTHVIIVLFEMGLFLRIVGNHKRKAALWVFYEVLAIICGLSGVRYLLALQCPLLLTAIVQWVRSEAFQSFRKRFDGSRESWNDLWKANGACFGKDSKAICVSFLGLLGSLTGYVINVVYVSKRYTFQTYESTNFIHVYEGNFLERVQNAFGSILMLFGYIPDKGVLSVRGIVTMAAFGMLVVLTIVAVKVRKTTHKENQFLVCFFYVSFLLNNFVFIFTNSTLVPRYYITTFVFLIPLFGIYLSEETVLFDRYVLTFVMVTCILLGSAKTDLSMMTADKNEARYPMAEFLVENGYKQGYATYWNGNIMQELTNGALQIANISNPEELEFFKWSSETAYYMPEFGNEKVFMILTAEEMETFEHAPAVKAGKCVFESDAYTVLHYDSKEVLFGQ